MDTAVKGRVSVSVPDRGRRKEAFARAFWCVMPVNAKDEASAYEAVLDQIGVSTDRDIEILTSIVQDAIMKAQREKLSAAPLRAFRDWLLVKRLGI